MKRAARKQAKATPAKKGIVTIGGKPMKLEYNFLAYSIMREAEVANPLDGVNFDAFTEKQYVGFIAAGLQTHQPDLEVEWLARNLSFKNFGEVSRAAIVAYLESLPPKRPGAEEAAANPQKPAS